MDIDDPPAGCTGPAFPLGLHKRTDAVFSDGSEVVKHAHMVFRAVARVQLFQPPAGELCTGVTKPVLSLHAGKQETLPVMLPVR
jgi:hypothetical protein